MAGMKREIELPNGMTAAVDGHSITISHQGKKVSRELGKEKVTIRVNGNRITLETGKGSKRENALLNTLESHVRNLIKGLEKPYEYKLAVVYSHFPMTVSVKGEWVEINNFLGEKKARKSRILPDTTVEVKGKEITVKSPNKENAGQTAANLEGTTRVIGKDRRVYQDGIFIVSCNNDAQ
jgi:large subunit ribosomal protein L6